ncbi:hypothetical protein PH210_16305 [Paenibacillus sp. BSR1-1]|uniref:hypothetical protein n=1 Tax=Paenibacillus sp. BSR1-1 TaxID=3020845 RepID=UPI0025B0F1A9|nr:hypothetical protein [Paenibacillus sp. BSR1-1]MDN3017762.1 hypothetical protein [Paenibacillus sp. BSR1-1]
MKRIIALSSFIFLFLLAVLPANVSHAAESVNVKGISLETDNGVVKATGTGNNFILNLIGETGNVKKLVITSDNADSVTIPGEPSIGLPDITGHFFNGKLDIDKSRFLGWLDKPENAPIKQAYNYLFPQYRGTDTIVSLQDIRENFYNENVIGGYVTDINGNQSEVNITLLLEGWKFVNGKWYLYDNDAQKITRWFKVNGKWYFFNPAGDMKTGWYKEKGKWYYLDPVNGDMAIGGHKIGGKWYYFDANGVMKTGWIKLGNKWIYLDPVNGDMKIGWIKIANKWYYLDPVNGDMKTGWVKLANKWYYLDPSSGVMKTGKVKIGSKTFTFATDGHWLY